MITDKVQLDKENLVKVKGVLSPMTVIRLLYFLRSKLIDVLCLSYDDNKQRRF